MSAGTDPKQRFHRSFLDHVAGTYFFIPPRGSDANWVPSHAVLQDQIEELKSISTVAGERQEAIDHILAGISKLQNEVADVADTTPAYDRKQYSEVKTRHNVS